MWITSFLIFSSVAFRFIAIFLMRFSRALRHSQLVIGFVCFMLSQTSLSTSLFVVFLS